MEAAGYSESLRGCDAVISRKVRDDGRLATLAGAKRYSELPLLRASEHCRENCRDNNFLPPVGAMQLLRSRSGELNARAFNFCSIYIRA